MSVFVWCVYVYVGVCMSGAYRWGVSEVQEAPFDSPIIFKTAQPTLTSIWLATVIKTKYLLHA